MKKHLLALLCLFAFILLAQGQSFNRTSHERKKDDAAVREIVQAELDDKMSPGISASLDWENAFGTRYNDTGKKHAFYTNNVAPLQLKTKQEILEVKVNFLSSNTAVADAYWHVIG
jgi:hypothetical protein